MVAVYHAHSNKLQRNILAVALGELCKEVQRFSSGVGARLYP